MIRVFRTIPLAAAVAAIAIISGCSDDQPETTQTEPPATQQPAEPSTGQQALDRLREATDLAGKAVREEAEKLRGQASEALENAQPTLEQAGQYAKQLQGRLETFTNQAIRDLNAGAQDLERRVREATGAPIVTPGDASATLPPPDQLNADTRAAAQPRPAGVVPDYVGVWASDAAACGRIDKEAVENFAVITPTTVRRAESVCNIINPPLENGRAVAKASCFAEGEEEEREILMEMPSLEVLKIGTTQAPGTVDMVRCHLPR